MKKKVLALVLTLTMLASLLTISAAAAGGKSFPDAVGHWAEDSILRWSRAGLIQGDDLGNVNPDKPLRRCEMALILSDMLGLRTAAPISTFRDIDGSEWYARAILRCAEAGIMEGRNGGMSYPEDYVTREEAITMFCRALGVARNDDPDLDTFRDGDEVSGWAAPYMSTLTELGILSGMGDGRIAPHDNINRAGAFTLMDKAISVYANAPGSYNTKNSNGFVVVNANTHNGGDVIVSGKATGVLVSVGATDTVRLRDLTAENVAIVGKSNVILSGKSKVDTLEVNKEVTVTVEADAAVDTLNLNVEKITVANAGTVNTLNCDTISTVNNSGKVAALVADAAATITNTGTVDKLVANATITVENTKGVVKGAEINVGGVVMDGPPQEMTLADGVVRPSNSAGRAISPTGIVSASSSSSRPSGGSSSSNRPSGGGSSSTTVAATGVTIAPEEPVTLKVGESATLTATVAPNNATDKKVTWSITEGEDVISIEQSDSTVTVTAKAVGEAKLEVKTTNGKTAECTVTVIEPGEPVVVIQPVPTLMFGGEPSSAELKVTVNGEAPTEDMAVVWSIDASGAATLEGNVVTAQAKGEAVVTVKVTIDGKDYTKTYTVKVGVPGETETDSVISVKITGADATLKVGATMELGVDVETTGDASKEVEWTVSNSNAEVSQAGVVKGLAQGSVTITATSKFDDTQSDSVTIQIEEAQQTPEVTVTVTLDATGTIQMKVQDAENGTKTITATVNATNATVDNSKVVWKVTGENGEELTDEAIVSVVTDGNTITVTAKGEGKAIITATYTDETSEKIDSATCTIEVAAAEAGGNGGEGGNEGGETPETPPGGNGDEQEPIEGNETEENGEE